METPQGLSNPAPNSRTIRVSLVEDSARVRASYQILINGTPGMECVSVHGTAEEAVDLLPGVGPDVVLMDINLPTMGGIECVRRLKLRREELRVVMLTLYADDDLIFAALSHGADGYLLKSTPPAEVLEAIQEVVAGGAPMSASIARRVIQSFRKTEHTDSEPVEGKEVPVSGNAARVGLSKREKEILTMLAGGFLYKEIADRLNIKYETVHTLIRRVYTKLHVRSRAEAVEAFNRPVDGSAS